MNRIRIMALAISSLAAACESAQGQPLLLPDVAIKSSTEVSSSDSTTQPNVALVQPTEIGGISRPATSAAEDLPAGISSGALSLEGLEQLAMANNPAIAQAAARITALRGRGVQAGLPPNPTIGYLADDIGENDTAGKQGGFIGQEFITGGKLRLDRAIVGQQIQQAEQWLETTRLRVQTDVRLAYYAALVAKRREALANELLQIGAKSVEDSARLKKLGEISKSDILPVEIEQRNAKIVLSTARTEQMAAWQRLSAVVGVDLPAAELSGDLSQLPTLLTYQDQLTRLTTTSPEVAAALAELGRSEVALARARREPIPNVSTQVSVQHDNSTGDTLAGVNVGIPLPVWNRNQGGILQSQAEVSEARRNLNRVESNLKNRLAIAFQRYAAAQERAKIYADEIVPRAEENFKLVQGAFPAQVSSLEYLTAQRTYFQTKLAYLDALAELWASWSEINGLLLSNSLSSLPESLR